MIVVLRLLVTAYSRMVFDVLLGASIVGVAASVATRRLEIAPGAQEMEPE